MWSIFPPQTKLLQLRDRMEFSAPCRPISNRPLSQSIKVCRNKIHFIQTIPAQLLWLAYCDQHVFDKSWHFDEGLKNTSVLYSSLFDLLVISWFKRRAHDTFDSFKLPEENDISQHSLAFEYIWRGGCALCRAIGLAKCQTCIVKYQT